MSAIVVQYVPGCPNLPVVLDHLKAAGADPGEIQLYEVSEASAMPDGFAGSPTVLIDGRNPLGLTETEVSMSCTLRIPSVKQLREATRPLIRLRTELPDRLASSRSKHHPCDLRERTEARSVCVLALNRQAWIESGDERVSPLTLVSVTLVFGLSRE